MGNIISPHIGLGDGTLNTVSYVFSSEAEVVVDIEALNLDSDAEVWMLCDFETDNDGEYVIATPSFDGGSTYNTSSNVNRQRQGWKDTSFVDGASISGDAFILNHWSTGWDLSNAADCRIRALYVFYDIADSARRTSVKNELLGFNFSAVTNEVGWNINGECENKSVITHLKFELTAGNLSGSIHINVRYPETGWDGQSPFTYLESATWTNESYNSGSPDREWEVADWDLGPDDILIVDYELHNDTDEKYQAFVHAVDSSPFTYRVSSSTQYQTYTREIGTQDIHSGGVSSVWPLASVEDPREPTNTADANMDGRVFFYNLPNSSKRAIMVNKSNYLEAGADNLIQCYNAAFQRTAEPVTALTLWPGADTGTFDGNIQFWKYGPV